MAKPGKPKTGNPRAGKRALMPRTKPDKPTATEHAANVTPTKPAPQDEEFVDARERWLADLAIRFKQLDGSIDLTDVLRDYAKVGLREICAAILDRDWVSAVASVVDKAFGEYLQRKFNSESYENEKRPVVWNAAKRDFEWATDEGEAFDLAVPYTNEGVVDIGKVPFITPVDFLAKAREALNSEFNLLAGSGGWQPIAPYPSGTNWDIGFALRSMVIPAPNGAVAVLGQPDPQACWREYTRLEHERNQTQLRNTRIDKGLRVRFEASNPLDAEMPHSFKASVTVLHSQFWKLFRGLMKGLLSCDGVHPVTRRYRSLDARIWARANIALDIRTGDLLNTRTGEVEWYDICLSGRNNQAQAPVYVQPEENMNTQKGRPIGHDWADAFDYLCLQQEDLTEFWKRPAYKTTILESLLLDAYKKVHKKPPHEREELSVKRAQNWLRAHQPQLWERAQVNKTLKY